MHESPLSKKRPPYLPLYPQHSYVAAVTFILHSELLSHHHTLQNAE